MMQGFFPTASHVRNRTVAKHGKRENKGVCKFAVFEKSQNEIPSKKIGKSPRDSLTGNREKQVHNKSILFTFMLACFCKGIL